MKTTLKQKLRKPLLPIARWLQSAGARPNHITLAGIVASFLAGTALAFGHLGLGLIWLIVSLLCDMLDGQVARLKTDATGPLGAFLDSCADRASEAFVFGGLLIGKQYHGGGVGWSWLLVWILAVSGSFLVSYARARAEGLGISCKVGLAERPERMLVLLVLLIAGFRASGWFLLGLTLLTWWTVCQRVVHVARRIGAAEADQN